MPSRNLSAWELDAASFDSLPPEKRTEFLARFAVLAPSSHNSQPWRFAAGADAVTVAPDMARSLPSSDPDHRQLYLSVGCAIENLCTAAEYYGFRTEVGRIDEGGLPAWKISLTGEPVAPTIRDAGHRALAIAGRLTNRNAYEPRMPERAFLDWLRSLATADLRIDLVSEDPLKKDIAAVVSDALIEAMDDPAFRLELSHYVRPNVTGAFTGMPMYGFGMPTPLSFLAPFLLRKVNVNKASRKQDEALLVEHTPLFVLISTRNDGPDAWMEAGRIYERTALEAARRGIATAPMAAAIQIGAHHRRLQQLLATDFRPQMFFRAGYAAAAPKHSPRIPAEKVMRDVTRT